ncbi:RNA-directed DNA polymerase, eukaryota, reverse transcriptase zinc-binding domain protein [Tanacetum coccineum]
MLNESNLDTIVRVLECFHRTSGLCLNMSKSKLMRIYVNADKVTQAARKIGCVTLKTSFTYLGSKVGGHMSRIQSWNETIEAMRFLSQNSSLWANIIKSIHGDHGKIGKHVKVSYPSIWLDIVKEVDLLKKRGLNLLSFVNKKVGNGSDTLFWEETWHGDVAFKFLFPRAYALESCKNIDVASKLSQNSLAFTFRREPRGGVEQDQFDSLKAMVEGTSLVNIRDRWIWSLQSSGDFTVASIRKLIDEFTLSEVSSSTRWIKAVPIKVNVLAWKIKLDNLPTRLNISRRGMDIDSILCPTCGKAVESTRHIFFTCQIARDILHLITSWWNIPYMEVSSYEEWPKASTFQKEKPVPSGNVTGFKQSIVQNQGGPKESYSSILKPSLVLDDSCLVNRDLTNCVMGEVLQFSSINNLQVLLSNEGFHNTRVVYLGGLWVMIELKSSKSKSKFMEHVGVASWFRRLCNAQSDFAAKERIVWVDIEGVPLNAWTRSTFQKISSKWGELVELEDGYDDLFARKRICIKTSQTENILESFKLIVKGKVFWARAKELFVWSPSFKDVPEKELFSDDESAKINEQANNLNNDEVENASEVVSDTYFGDNGEVQGFEQCWFWIYWLLRTWLNSVLFSSSERLFTND